MLCDWGVYCGAVAKVCTRIKTHKVNITKVNITPCSASWTKMKEDKGDKGAENKEVRTAAGE